MEEKKTIAFQQQPYDKDAWAELKPLEERKEFELKRKQIMIGLGVQAEFLSKALDKLKSKKKDILEIAIAKDCTHIIFIYNKRNKKAVAVCEYVLEEDNKFFTKEKLGT